MVRRIKMKIKIFSSNNMNDLERTVNDFLKDKIVYNIKFSSIAVPKQYKNGIPINFDVIDRVMIQYEEWEDIKNG